MDEKAFGCNIASVLTTHIDDLKGSSTESERTLLLNLLKKDYGSDVKCELGTFEHVGIKHEQKEDFSVWTHQDHYVKEISEMNIVTADMTDPDTLLDDNLKQTFWSLLGALSWLLQTRADLSPYIGHLQRVAKAPTCRHTLLANKVLR